MTIKLKVNERKKLIQFLLRTNLIIIIIRRKKPLKIKFSTKKNFLVRSSIAIERFLL